MRERHVQVVRRDQITGQVTIESQDNKKGDRTDYVIHAVSRGRAKPLLQKDSRGDWTPTNLGDDIMIHLENNGYLVEIEEAQ